MLKGSTSLVKYYNVLLQISPIRYHLASDLQTDPSILQGLLQPIRRTQHISLEIKNSNKSISNLLFQLVRCSWFWSDQDRDFAEGILLVLDAQSTEENCSEQWFYSKYWKLNFITKLNSSLWDRDVTPKTAVCGTVMWPPKQQFVGQWCDPQNKDSHLSCNS